MKRITKIEAAQFKEERKLRVAAYARVSTDTEEQLVSLETQKRHYDSYIKSRGDWEYAGLYYDENLSGTNMDKRDGLLSLLAACEEGKIDRIIVKSISRFSRNTVDTVETVRHLNDLGISVFFEKENIDTANMESELLLSTLSSLAENESRSLSDNCKWSTQKRFQNGTYKLTLAPYGYRCEDGALIIDEAKAETVKWIFEQVLSGMSCSRIAKTLNERGILSMRNGKWRDNVISGMIKNEKYVGDVIFQKTYTDDRFNRHINHGEKNRYYVKDHHEAIIRREDYAAANAVLERNGLEKGIVRGERKSLNRYAFSGKIICGECGSNFKRVTINKRPYYACIGHIRNKDTCSIKTIPEDSFKAAFTTMMNKLSFSRERILIPLAAGMKKAGNNDSSDKISKIDIQLENIVTRRIQIAEFFSKGFIDPTIFAQEIDSLSILEERLTEEKKKLTAQFNGDRSKIDSFECLLDETGKLNIMLDFDEALFLRHVDHIIVYKRTEIGFALKCGPVFRERI